MALALGVLTAREFAVGRDAVAAADAAAAAKSDWREAIAQARIAAEALAPASPWPERGLRRLEAIGHDAEARGDDPTALLAYGAMRTAALETRAPGGRVRSDRWRHAAEEGLGRVAASSKDTPRSRALRPSSPSGPTAAVDARANGSGGVGLRDARRARGARAARVHGRLAAGRADGPGGRGRRLSGLRSGRVDGLGAAVGP